jgi:signal transduction histidine kinase
VAVVATTGVSSWLATRAVRSTLEQEFDQGLERVAATAAREISAAQVTEARLRDEGAGYLSVQVQLVTLRGATGVADASLIDTARMTLVDARQPDLVEGAPTPLARSAGDALTRALRGATTVSEPHLSERRPVKAAFAPVTDERGHVVGVVAVEANATYLPVVADLGRRLLLIALVTMLAIAILAAFVLRGAASAAQLERRLSRAENLAAMGRLTATLAHEIKNPLAIIRGSAQRLGKLDPEADRMARFVVEETDRLSHTVERYLQFARGEQVAGESGDALSALAATLDLLEGELAARRVTLARPAAAAGSAPVALDNESLKQLYLNLILNAIEAMPDGGRLEVTTSERSGCFEIVIADQGVGIPAETLKTLGTPFVTTKVTGSGLGLFLARRLAQSAGGELVFESEPGRGTTCRVRLPRVRAMRARV